MKKKNKTIIIAEAGVNHNGSLKLAKKMVIDASKAGADYIKFQIFVPESLSTAFAEKPHYVKNIKNKSQLEMLKKLKLNEKDLFYLKKYCVKHNIKFLVSVFDEESLIIFKKLKLNLLKIPSGEINNIPLLQSIGKLKKKVILSTGMSSLKEINDAIKILVSYGLKKKQISILQCTTEYPAPFTDLNLKVIHLFKKRFKLRVGFSDHSLGIEASIAAVSMGAEIIEKHFTLSKSFKGPDHKASLTVKELTQLVKSIRNLEKAFGIGKKYLTHSEKKNIKIVRKSIVAKKNILQGEYFTTNNITTKRPAIGKSPNIWSKVLGKKAKKNYLKDQLI